MADETAAYEIVFYEDDDGNEPALKFMQSLEGKKRRAIGVALTEFLGYLGPDVVKGDFGDTLGDGLYEFRVDQDAAQLLRRKGKEPKPETDEGKILLRMFFHPYGNKLLLLLGGYDKSERTSKRHQQEEIELAKKMLKHWKQREKLKKPTKSPA